MGLWPSVKALTWWIKTQWKPKGEITLKMGSKGFFMTIFNLVEDQERVFQGGPYFFNSVTLYMRIWKENFSSEKEDFTATPVWIRLYSLPQEYWCSKILEIIWNTLESFVRIT